MGNLLGKPLRVDETTLVGVKGQYASISVEIDLEKPLVSKFKFLRRVRKVEYEGLHAVCFHHSRYGHKAEGCPKIPSHEQTPNPINIEVSNADTKIASIEQESPKLFEAFNEWMLAQRCRRSKVEKTPPTTTSRAPLSNKNPVVTAPN